jgi:hypothetical protein
LQKKLRLTKKEHEYSDTHLVKFGENVRWTERKHTVNQNRPKSSYFPSSVIESILDQLLALDTLAPLEHIVQSWFFFSSGYLTPLYALIQNLQKSIRTQREEAWLAKNAKQQATWRAKKAIYDSELEEEDEESDSSTDEEVAEHPRSSPIPPPSKHCKRVLDDITNEPQPRKAPPATRNERRKSVHQKCFSYSIFR